MSPTKYSAPNPGAALALVYVPCVRAVSPASVAANSKLCPPETTKATPLLSPVRAAITVQVPVSVWAPETVYVQAVGPTPPVPPVPVPPVPPVPPPPSSQ